jgi:hypothetical protein
MFDPCPLTPALELCSSARCSDTKLFLVVDECKTNECDTVNLLAMQHDGWVLAVTGRRQAYLLGTVPLPRILPTLARISSRSRHRAPVDKVKFSDRDSDVLAFSSFPRLTLVSRCYVPGCYKTKGARHITTLVTRGTGS